MLSPTDEGQATLDRIYATYRSMFETGLESFPPDKLRELREMLDIITARFMAPALNPDEGSAGESA